MNSSKSTACLLSLIAFCLSPVFSTAEVNKAEQIAPDVYSHEGDIKSSGHCNNGWIGFEERGQSSTLTQVAALGFTRIDGHLGGGALNLNSSR